MFKKPNSLLGQIVLLLVLVIIFNFVVFIAALRAIAVLPGAQQLADMITTQALLLEQLHKQQKTVPLAEQVQTLYTKGPSTQLSAPPSVLSIASSIEADPFPTLVFFDALQTRLKKQLGNTLKIEFQTLGDNSKIWIQPDWSESQWLGFQFPGFIQRSANWILALLLASAFLSALLGGLYARHISRSLRTLGEMAEAHYLGQPTNNSAQCGPFEVRQLTDVVKRSAQSNHALIEYRKMLLAGISHDLRTPMARIQIAAELVNDEDLRLGMNQDIEEMDDIIDDFITFVRDGDNEEAQQLDLVAIIREVCAAQARLQQIVSLNITDDIPPLWGRPSGLRRAVNNLLNNAFRHGAAPVLCSLQNETTPKGQWLVLTVRDHGNGISEDLINTVCQPFVQGNSARGIVGSGLGLAIVHQIAEQHSTHLQLENLADGGLQASLRFPIF